MQRQSVLRPAAFIFILISVFAGASVISANLIAEKQKKGMVPGLKMASLRPQHELTIRTHKLQPPFEVQIYKGPTSTEDQIVLTAKISTNKSIPQLRYQWIVEEDIFLSPRFSAEGQIDDVSPKTGAIIHAEFLNSTMENRKIHLKVFASDGQNAMVQMAHYNTRDQEKIDEYQAELAAKNHEYLLGQPELLRKNK